MLIELTCQTALAGRFDDFRAALTTGGGLEMRIRHGARLLFFTTGDSGPLNECVLAWQHDSMAALAAHRETLAADPAWRAWQAGALALLRGQTSQFVETTPFTTPEPSPSACRLVDLRTYRFKPGGLAQFLPVSERAGLPLQRKHLGPLVFHGVAASGTQDCLVQAWAYPDHADYEARSAALFRDPGWNTDYRNHVLHLVDLQEHRYLRSLPASSGRK